MLWFDPFLGWIDTISLLVFFARWASWNVKSFLRRIPIAIISPVKDKHVKFDSRKTRAFSDDDNHTCYNKCCFHTSWPWLFREREENSIVSSFKHLLCWFTFGNKNFCHIFHLYVVRSGTNILNRSFIGVRAEKQGAVVLRFFLLFHNHLPWPDDSLDSQC